MALALGELNTVMQEVIAPGLVDNFFLSDPGLAFMKNNVQEFFAGGTFEGGSGRGSIRETFMYDKLVGASYDWDGSVSFDTTEPRIIASTAFDPKHYYVSVVVRKEEIQVYNKGENAALDLLEARFINAALTMSRMLAIDFYQHGQDKSGDAGTNRTGKLNGLSEILSDGTTDSYDTHTFTSYGGVTRTDVSGALDSTPKDLAGVPITYGDLVREYADAVIGPEAPNLGITSNVGEALIKEAFQPQQFITSVDPVIGFRGIEFENSRIIRSLYVPSDANNAKDSDVPGVTGTNAEALFFLNTNYFRFWITDDPEFAFGFSGFKPAQGDNKLVGQVFFVGNITCQGPRYSKQIYGFV